MVTKKQENIVSTRYVIKWKDKYDTESHYEYYKDKNVALQIILNTVNARSLEDNIKYVRCDIAPSMEGHEIARIAIRYMDKGQFEMVLSTIRWEDEKGD